MFLGRKFVMDKGFYDWEEIREKPGEIKRLLQSVKTATDGLQEVPGMGGTGRLINNCTAFMKLWLI